MFRQGRKTAIGAGGAAIAVSVALFAASGLGQAQAEDPGAPAPLSAAASLQREYPLLTKQAPSGLATENLVQAAASQQGVQPQEQSLPVGNEMFDPAAAREVKMSDPTVRVWGVASREQGICVLLLPINSGNIGPASSCSRSVDAGNGVVLTYGGATAVAPQVVSGLVPAGVDRVVATLRDGSARELDVRENAFAATLPTPAHSLTFKRGAQTIDLLAGTE